MRFIENGPILPDELLFAHDEEQAVFFCGSGVSAARVRLPNFTGLVESVLRELRVPEDNDACRLFRASQSFAADPAMRGLSSADRVFGLLTRTFTLTDIDAAVAKALRPPENADLWAHKVLLRLGRSRGGQTRLITTNFDRLFEVCDKRLKFSTRSHFPRIQFTDNDWGIVHLHGCVLADYSGPTQDGFVLSSAEFGNAYLAQGWARDFIRELLDRYTAVFVGYSADDPPMRYLLEGIQQGGGHKHKIYAFQDGSDNEAMAQWNDKGVEPIVYAISNSGDHEALWQTLAAWAKRNDSPGAWRKKVFVMGRKGPANLAPHERGMVAHLVRSDPGAIAFSREEPPLPAEWLCVFDPYVRFADPIPNFSALQEPVADPFPRYRLDDDAEPSYDENNIALRRLVPKESWDAFAVNAYDRRIQADEQLSSARGHWARSVPRLSPRLSALGAWISRVADDATCAWWAARQSGLHPDIVHAINTTITQPGRKTKKVVRDAWRTIFEIAEYSRSDLDQYYLTANIAAAGWGPATIREYAAVFAPYLERDYFRTPNVPPTYKKLARNHVIKVDVKYPDQYDVLVPDEFLARVVDHQRFNLENAADLESEYGRGWLEINSIEPDTHEGEDDIRAHDLSGYALHFADLFRRLVAIDPTAAKQELAKWRQTDSLFQRLRTWAAGFENVLSSSDAAAVLDSLDRDAFWSFKGERDLLIVLARRWGGFTVEGRARIERKILRGPARSRHATKEENEERSAHWQLSRFNWLAAQGCELTLNLAALTENLRKKAPNWKPEYAIKAAESHDPQSGWIKTDTDWSTLTNVPVSDILAQAEKSGGRLLEEFTERAPFTGLSADAPVKAISALASATKRGEFKPEYWEAFLSHKNRAADKPKLKFLVAGRLVQVTDEAMAQILLTASRWFEIAGPDIRMIGSCEPPSDRPKLFDRLWNKFVAIMRDRPQSAGSALLRQRGEADWVTEAINAPAGNLAQLHMTDPAKSGLELGCGFPPPWLERVEELLSLPGDSRRFALVIFAYNLGWFDYIDPAWCAAHLLSCIDPDNAESNDADALWSGFLWGGKIPGPTLYARLKPQMLLLARGRSNRGRRHSEVLSRILLAGWKSLGVDGSRYVTSAEMQSLILDTDDELRSYIIWHLEKWTKADHDKWLADLLDFLTAVWPRHSKIRTAKMSARLCDLAIALEDDFPAVSKRIIQLVSVVDEAHVFIREISTRDDTISSRYPSEMLDLLYVVLSENPARWPYGAAEVLGKIEKAMPSLLKNPKLIALKSRLNEV